MARTNGKTAVVAQVVQPQVPKETVTIPPIRVETINVRVQGISTLVIHRFTEKAKKQMLDKQLKKAKAPREVRDPAQEFNEARYIVDGKDCIPAIHFKQSCISTAKTILDSLNKTFVRQAFFIRGDMLPIEGPPPVMREDIVRLANGDPIVRFRPEYVTWGVKLAIEFNPSVVSAEQIVNLLSHAGFHSGVGEMRPERGGTHGRFKVE